MTLVKGSIVFGKAQGYTVSPGLKGVCHNVYEVQGRPAYGIIFENGLYDSFSPGEVELHLTPVGRISPGVASYQFQSAAALVEDFKQGRFDEAFRASRPALQLVR